LNRRFQELREEIAANDRRIVEAVNERLRLVDELWQLKETLSVSRFDREREHALLTELVDTNSGPLSSAGLTQLMNEVFELTKRELSDRS
jgi:chorismate mutase